VDALVLYDYLFSWYHDKDRWGTTPTEDVLLARFAEVDLPKRTTYTLNVLVSMLVEEKMRRHMAVHLPGIENMSQVNPSQALEMMQELCSDLAPVVGATSLDLATSAYDHIIKEMELIGTNDGIIGIPWPWSPINEGTGGACPGKFTLVSAPPKTGKTMFCLEACAHFFGYHHARVAVIVGKEMQGPEVLTILACQLARISLEKYWRGQLLDDEKARFLDFLQKLRSETNMSGMRSKLRIYEDNGEGLAAVREAINSFGPDVLYYDALYAAADDLDWRKQSNLITEACGISNRTKVHFLASWQSHIREAKTSGIEDQSDYAYSQNVYAKPDLSIKLRRPARASYMWVGFPAERKLPIKPFKINYSPGDDMAMAANQQQEKEEREDTPLW